MKFILCTTFMAAQMLYACLSEEVNTSKEVHIMDDGTNDTNNTEVVIPELPSSRAPLYEALRSLNPNTLNLTIYWSCISTEYAYLSQYGAFQKDDASYLQCKADGHFLYERSCLHNLLAATNCVDGVWECEAHWLNNVDHAVSWVHKTAKIYPQCFTDFGAMEHHELSWDCEEDCDLPCSYPEQFCTTIKKSYDTMECEIECAKDRNGGRRLRQGAHDMVLQFGSFIATAAPSPSSTAAPSPSAVATSSTSKPRPSRRIIFLDIAVYALVLASKL